MSGFRRAGRALRRSPKPRRKKVSLRIIPTFDLKAVDSFIEIHGDGTVLVKIGKINNGQGTPTSWAMMAAEELDVPLEQCRCAVRRHGSDARSGWHGRLERHLGRICPLRQAAATARQALLELASEKLDVPVRSLTVKDGIVTGTSNAQSVSYAELIGDKKFNISFSASAPVKDPRSSTSSAKHAATAGDCQSCYGKLEFTQDVHVPGMLHARSVRPPVAGSTLVSVDGFDGGDPAGLVKVVSKGNYVAVVAKTEWQAIQAAHAESDLEKAATPVFPTAMRLCTSISRRPPLKLCKAVNVGDVDAALASAAQTITATYQSAFQSHASMTPGCCVADVKDGGATVWFGGQKPYRVRTPLRTCWAFRSRRFA